MPLKLRVISDQYKELGKTSSQLFGVTGGSIGRAPDNDWVLPDPERYVSSHHAKVSFRAGSWLLEDVSTNGVFVNDSDSPLSITGPRKLKDGDRLRFGDYDIVVSIDDHNDFSADASGQMPPPPALRGQSERRRDTRTTSHEAREEQANYLRRGSYRNQSSDLLSEDLGAELDITGLLVSGSRDAKEELDAVAAFDSEIQDRNAFAVNAAAASKASPNAITSNITKGSLKTVSAVVTAQPIAPRASQPASLPGSLLDDFLEVDKPRAVGAGAGSAAEADDNWHMTTRRLQQRKPSATTPAPLLQVVADAAPKVAAMPQPVHKPPMPVSAARGESRTESKADFRQEPTSRVEPDRSRRTNDYSGDLQAGVEALCRGAGIDPTALPADAYSSLLTLAGQMLREVVLDLMEALRNRSEQKNQLQIDQTAMQPGLNNPLKFAPSVEDALRRLLDGHSMRYMGAVEALREAFGDLKNHQMALDAAMHTALNDLLTRVDPVELQGRFDNGLKRNPQAGGANKTKYWELYSDFYPLLNQRDSRGWPAVFSDEFTRAYSTKMDELEKRRK